MSVHSILVSAAILSAAVAPRMESSGKGIEPAAPAGTMKIVCFGDSITEGYAASSPATKSYPAALQRLLDDKYGKGAYTVVNAGISGQDTRQGLTRVDEVTRRNKPDWVLIEYGTNDMWTARHITAAETGANLGKIIEHIRTAGAKPVIATLTPAYGSDKEVAARNEVIRKTAEERQVPLVDLNGAFEKALADAGGRDKKAAWEKYYAKEDDGYLHPNDFGYAFLAGEWLKGFEKAAGPGPRAAGIPSPSGANDTRKPD